MIYISIGSTVIAKAAFTWEGGQASSLSSGRRKVIRKDSAWGSKESKKASLIRVASSTQSSSCRRRYHLVRNSPLLKKAASHVGRSLRKGNGRYIAVISTSSSSCFLVLLLLFSRLCIASNLTFQRAWIEVCNLVVSLVSQTFPLFLLRELRR